MTDEQYAALLRRASTIALSVFGSESAKLGTLNWCGPETAAVFTELCRDARENAQKNSWEESQK